MFAILTLNAKIYHAAVDIVESLNEAKINDLIEFCFSNNIINSKGKE